MATNCVDTPRGNCTEPSRDPPAVTGRSVSCEESVGGAQCLGVIIGTSDSRNPPSIEPVSLSESDRPVHIADGGLNGRRRSFQGVEVLQGQSLSSVLMDADDE